MQSINVSEARRTVAPPYSRQKALWTERIAVTKATSLQVRCDAVFFPADKSRR